MYNNIKISALINLPSGLNSPIKLRVEDFQNFEDVTNSALIIIDTEHLTLLQTIVNSNKYSYIIEDKFNESIESRVSALKSQIDEFFKYNQIDSVVIIGNKLFETYQSMIDTIHVTSMNLPLTQEINNFWNMLTEIGFSKSISKHSVMNYPPIDDTMEILSISIDYTILELNKTDQNIIVE